ncbi:hypothetical protein ACH5RR_031198 [Cinchona calisaya]|uniref:Uncharacterized protein n=1 Tax=Cinchona calisaya TaxID=153742 RepID=A0ABD2YFU7_9GENT
MGTEVLRPQDFLYNRFRLSTPAFHRRKSYVPTQKPITSGHKRPVPRPDRSDQKKKTHQLPQPPKRSASANELQSREMHAITILGRGQSLDTIDATRMKKQHSNNVRHKFIMHEGDDVYAGSAFFASPSPSSLPLPSFFNVNNHNNLTNNHDSATRDLRRLLRLE